jgi:hypothetical protein
MSSVVGDVFGILMMLMFLGLGLWAVSNPHRVIGYLLGQRASELKGGGASAVFIMRCVGGFFVIFSVVVILALVSRHFAIR